jgi:hypothetical protein
VGGEAFLETPVHKIEGAAVGGSGFFLRGEFVGFVEVFKKKGRFDVVFLWCFCVVNVVIKQS